MSFLRMSEVSLSGKRVFIRCDFNVPQDDNGEITDDTRIRAALPGLRLALKAGAAVMATSHLGRPKEGVLTAADSLQPVAERLSQLLGITVPLVTGWVEQGVNVAPGELVLLENCRCNVGEKADDPKLAQTMAALCDVYVNDAFGTAHRAEATTHGMARYAPIAVAGPLMAAELDALGRALISPKPPVVAVVGGSKVSTKIGVLESLAGKVDRLIVGGGIANTFMLASGLPIGRSLAEPDMVVQAKRIMAAIAERGGTVPLPVDVMVGQRFAADTPATLKLANDVGADDLIFDVGPKTHERYAALFADAGTILWNGPVGVFEFPAFASGTARLAAAIAASPAFSIAGGGDTLAAIAQFGVAERIGYLSTGGGAFLEFLEGKTLPAVAALLDRNA